MPLSIESLLQKRVTEYCSGDGGIRLRPVGGGSINEAYQLNYANRTLFCKVNSASKFPHLFKKEKSGLEVIARQNIIKTPAVVDQFEEDGKQFLLLEWINEGERSESFWKSFGEQLAALHQVSATSPGLPDDNYMGNVPQRNTPHQAWCTFFAEERLSPMLRRCADKGLLTKTHLASFDKLNKCLSTVFDDAPPSLLHGDLWSGNFMCNSSSEPVLIDPAVYFGHRSMDLAMTTLFGGFRPSFYESYHGCFPFPPNYKEQWAVCNLYPLLIHLYLFGSGYLSQIEKTLQRFS